MAKLLADFRTKVDQALQDKAGDLTQAEKDAFIAQAIGARYSRIRPFEKVADIAGDGSAFDFSLPAGWEKGFSVVKSIEFPAGERNPVFLEDEDWIIYEDTSAEKLRLLSATPSATQTLRVTFTMRHAVDLSTGTVPDADFDAVADFAAGLSAAALSSRYAQLTDTTIGADSVDHKSKSEEFGRIARERFKLFNKHFGLKENETVDAGMAFKDLDVNFPWGGDRLTHPRRFR